jgi:ribosomal protein L28
MAKQCAICQKKGIMARKLNKLRGKYNPTPKKRKYPNLQWVRVPINTEKKAFRKFAGKRIIACSKCIKTLSKLK